MDHSVFRYMVALLLLTALTVLLMRISTERYEDASQNPYNNEYPTFKSHCYDTGGLKLGLGMYTFNALNNLGFFNIKGGLSCIKVPRAYIVTLYDRDNFTGNKTVIEGETSSTLYDNIYSRWVMSITVEVIPMFYSTCNWGDFSMALKVGAYTKGDAQWSMYQQTSKSGDTFGESCIVPLGYTVRLYSGDAFDKQLSTIVGPAYFPCIHVYDTESNGPVSVGSIVIERTT